MWGLRVLETKKVGVGLLFLFTSCFGRVGTGEGWEKQNTTIFSRKNSFFAFSVFPTLAPPRTHDHKPHITPHYTPLHMNYNALVFWSLLKGCADDTKKIEIFRDIWCSKNFPEPKIVYFGGVSRRYHTNTHLRTLSPHFTELHPLSPHYMYRFTHDITGHNWHHTHLSCAYIRHNFSTISAQLHTTNHN